MRNSTSYEAGTLRPRWPIFLITRNERPYKGWWGSRTSTTSGNDSSDSLLGTFLNPLVQGHQLRRIQLHPMMPDPRLAELRPRRSHPTTQSF